VNTVTLRNLNNGSTPINNQEVRGRFNFTIDRQHLTPGHRYQLEVTATITDAVSITTRKTVEFAVQSDTPVFRLGFSEWSINNGTTRILTYVTNPANETVELYHASDNSRRTVNAQASRIHEERNSTPRIIINAGFMDGSNNSIGTTFSETFGLYLNGRFLGFNDPENRLNDLGRYGLTSHFITLFYFRDRTTGEITTELHNHGTITRQTVMNRVNDSNRSLIFAVTGTIPSGTVFNGITLNRDNPEHSDYFRDKPNGDNEFIEPAMRSMMGVTANGNIIFLAADTGRTNQYGRGERGGISVDTGANILRGMGAVTVLNLDGGSSTQMFHRDIGRVIHPPFDGSSNAPVYRIVGSVFLVW
jgi:hypothetical protein